MAPDSNERGLGEPGQSLRGAIVAWCLVSSLAVVLTRDVPFWLAALVLLLIPAFGLARNDTRALRPVRATSSVLAIFYLLFFPIDWLFLSDRLIFAVVHLIFYLKLHTLLTLRTARDRNRLYALCLFEMLAAASMTVDFTFIVPLVFFVVLGALVMLLDEALLRAGADAEPGILRPAVGAALGLGAAVILVAGSIFALIPRVGEGGFRLGGVGGLTSTGISDHVELGDFGTIKQSQDVVMRVVAGEPGAGSPPRWRGSAFDRYENGRWFQSLAGTQVLSESGPQEFFLAPLGPDAFRETLRSEVFLEPLDTDLLFMPPGSLHLKVSVRYVYVDRYLTLRAGRLGAGRRYIVRWKPEPELPTGVWGGVQPLLSTHRPFYLQLPPLSREFKDLAGRVVPNGSVPEMASGVESYLRKTYRYTLDTPSRVRADPLEDFLFDARAGHCEYFATAMVLLLRARGAPARLVTGFLRGEVNEVGKFEVIRKSRAHAWVEVFDPERGWLIFDPTPSGGSPSAAGTFTFLTDGAESIRMLWDKYVITFDRERQRGVLGGIREATDPVVAAVARAAVSQRRRIVGVGAVVTVGLLAAVGLRVLLGRRFPVLARLRWSFRRGKLRADRPESAVKFYGSLLDRLDKLGFAKPPGATPAEYARAHESRLPGLVDLTDVYYQVRYGARALTREEQARAERLALAIQVAAWSSAELGPTTR